MEESKKFKEEEENDLNVAVVEDNKESSGGSSQYQQRLEEYLARNSWESLGLAQHLCEAVREHMNWERPSKIQSVGVPMAIQPPYKSILAQAKNGAGKTGSFVLSLLHRVDMSVNGLQGAILAITRELAIQIFRIISKLTQSLNDFKVALLVSGVEPKSILESNPHVIVASPDTLKKFVVKYKDQLTNLKVFVIDEADDMFNDNNKRALVDSILTRLPKDCQKLLYSATFTPEITGFMEKFVPDCIKITKKSTELSLDQVKQLIIKTDDDFKLIGEIFSHVASNATIIFVNTRRNAEKLKTFLDKHNHPAEVLMGGIEKELRDKVFIDFMNRKFEVLITTNVLARGIDLRFVKCVINFDLPILYEEQDKVDRATYLHRIGRTGRFGDRGVAINFVKNPKDENLVSQLVEFYGTPMQEVPDYITDLEGIIREHLEEQV